MRSVSVIAETENFAVVFKPPRMHCAPNKHNNGGTLLDWYASIFPQVMHLSGKKKGEGGLLHRLDYETHGLVLFAKNQHSLDNLMKQQDEGIFIKEYSAVCCKSGIGVACSPTAGRLQGSGIREKKLGIRSEELGIDPTRKPPLIPTSYLLPPHPPVSCPWSPIPDPRSPTHIESYFRPFGPGRKQVRPVTDLNKKSKDIATDKGGYYRTEIVKVEELTSCLENIYHFTLRLKRGFRHQIRCHLAWIGYPVVNDPLYGSNPCDGYLALSANGLFFTDPESSEPVNINLSL